MSRNWFYWSGNREVGPLTQKELNQIAAQGRIGRDTLVREGKNGSWLAASSFGDVIVLQTHASSDPNGPPPLPQVARESTASGSNVGAREAYQNYAYAGVAVC